MKLSLSQIKNITIGSVRIEDQSDGIHFYRFTKEQEELYKKRNPDFYIKSFSTSGVKLCFKTNSHSLYIKTSVTKGSSRSYFAFDIFVNDTLIGTLDNFSNENMGGNYTKNNFMLGEFSKSFQLGDGEKIVCVYLPWSVAAVIKELALDDGATLTPVKPAKRMLCFGDSITQGYDALHPSNKYITRIAHKFGAQEHNKAIGGEIFVPELVALKDDFKPDYIVVAYGSNDWNRSTKEEFENNCKSFFSNLIDNYSDSKVFVITPIWRKDMIENRPIDFLGVCDFIKKTASQYSTITVIEGFDFVPKQEKYFADLRLHPNDMGFDFYFKSLSKKL